jgi:AcrR family transcriptional regulator
MSGARERIREAMLELVLSRGYNAVTVTEIVERAGVNDEEFSAQFASKQDCALEVVEGIQNDFRRRVREAYEKEQGWPDSLRAALYASADWITEHPREGRFSMVEMLWVSDHAKAHRETGFPLFIEMVDAGREQAQDPDLISPFTAEGVVGSIIQLATKQLRRDGAFKPHTIVPELMYTAVLPYLGEEAASRELTIPPPSHSDAG